MDKNILKMFVIGLGVGTVLVLSVIGGIVIDRKVLNKSGNLGSLKIDREVVNEESVVTKVVEQATPSVVTVSISKKVVSNPTSGFDFFGQFFGMPMMPNQQQQQQQQKVEQDIGTGFIISSDGLIVTNKHVVSDTSASYRVVVGKDQVVDVANIYRDPITDLAILKINKTGLTPIKLGDSNSIKVGQTVIAIGTALGEFRSTVTTGVISGLGRVITAGSPFEGSEQLSNVIQTDAAINPGNSGGPLFNSSGEVIGVNVAVSQSGQNIGFALPINLVKDSIANFKTTGEFNRPYFGVSYQLISKQTALLNDVPAGAYVKDVVVGSPAEKAGIKTGDIITEFDGKKMADDTSTALATLVNNKKVGDSVTVKYWRDNKENTISVKLDKRPEGQ